MCYSHSNKSSLGRYQGRVPWVKPPRRKVPSVLLAKPLGRLGRDLKKDQPHNEFLVGLQCIYWEFLEQASWHKGTLAQNGVYSMDMNYPGLRGAGSCLAWWLRSHLHRDVCSYTVYSGKHSDGTGFVARLTWFDSGTFTTGSPGHVASPLWDFISSSGTNDWFCNDIVRIRMTICKIPITVFGT